MIKRVVMDAHSSKDCMESRRNNSCRFEKVLARLRPTEPWNRMNPRYNKAGATAQVTRQRSTTSWACLGGWLRESDQLVGQK